MKAKEETIASRVFDLLSDVRLDPHMIGFYLAHSADPNIYDTLSKIIEATTLTRAQRADRIKTMILGDDVVNIDTKCEVLADVLSYDDEYGYFDEFRENHDVSLGLAFAVVNGMVVSLTGNGEQTINQAWDDLMEYTDNKDSHISSFDELVASVPS